MKEKVMPKSHTKTMVIIATIALVMALPVTALAVSPSNVSLFGKWFCVNDYSYEIFSDGINTYAKNGDDCSIDYGGPNDAGSVDGNNAATVILAAADNMIENGVKYDAPDHQHSTGGKMKIKTGIYNVTSEIWIKASDPYGIQILGDGIGNTVFRVPPGTTLTNVIHISDSISGGSAQTLPFAPVLRGFSVVSHGNTTNVINMDGATAGTLEDISVWIDQGRTTNAAVLLTGGGGSLGQISHFYVHNVLVENLGGNSGGYGFKLTSANQATYLSHTLSVGFDRGYDINTSGHVIMWEPRDMGSTYGIVASSLNHGFEIYSPQIMGGGDTVRAFHLATNQDGARATIYSPAITTLKSGTGIAFYLEMREPSNQVSIYNMEASSNIPILFGGVLDNTAVNPTLMLIGNDFRNVTSLGTIPSNIEVKGYGNLGILTENDGTGTISSGSTNAWVSHGIRLYTPMPSEISVIPTEDPTNTVGTIFVSNVNATHFRVNVENDPGASNLDFSWSIRRIG